MSRACFHLMPNGARFRILLLIALPHAPAACRDGNGPDVGEGVVRVDTDRAVYAPGDSMQLTLTNTGSATVLYTFCPLYLERQVGSSWVETGSSSLGPFGETSCETQAQWFHAGEVVTHWAELPDTLSPGMLRVRFQGFRNYDTGLPLLPAHHASGTFEVRE